MHNPSGRDRVAMVCRYAPWWLSVQEFSGNQVGYISLADWRALPLALQPLLRHCVHGEDPAAEEEVLADVIQPHKQELTAPFANTGLERERSDDANAHVVMPVAAWTSAQQGLGVGPLVWRRQQPRL
jgi:hypothetical protein